MFIENFAAKTLSQIISGLEEEALLFIEIYFQNINSSPKASGTEHNRQSADLAIRICKKFQHDFWTTSGTLPLLSNFLTVTVGTTYSA